MKFLALTAAAVAMSATSAFAAVSPSAIDEIAFGAEQNPPWNGSVQIACSDDDSDDEHDKDRHRGRGGKGHGGHDDDPNHG